MTLASVPIRVDGKDRPAGGAVGGPEDGRNLAGRSFMARTNTGPEVPESSMPVVAASAGAWLAGLLGTTLIVVMLALSGSLPRIGR
jgi:hypothetical protein